MGRERDGEAERRQSLEGWQRNREPEMGKERGYRWSERERWRGREETELGRPVEEQGPREGQRDGAETGR